MRKLLLLLCVFIPSVAYSMNKAELVEAMAKDANLSTAQARLIYTKIISVARKGVLTNLDGFAFEPFGLIKSNSLKELDLEAGETLLENVATSSFATSFFMELAHRHAELDALLLETEADKLDENEPMVVASILLLEYQRSFSELRGSIKKALLCQQESGGDCDDLWEEIEGKLKHKDIPSMCRNWGGFERAVKKVERNLDQRRSLALKIWNAGVEAFLIRIRKRPDLLLSEWDELIDEAIGVMRENPLFHEKGTVHNNPLFESNEKKAHANPLSRGVEKSDIRRGVLAFNKNTLAALKKGDRVQLVGFGSFSISRRAARTGRNPQTGATITVSSKAVAKFKAGKALADAVKAAAPDEGDGIYGELVDGLNSLSAQSTTYFASPSRTGRLAMLSGLVHEEKKWSGISTETRIDSDSRELNKAKKSPRDSKKLTKNRKKGDDYVQAKVSKMLSTLGLRYEDMLLFYDKGNAAAGARVRKAMQELKNLAQDIRREVQSKKNH